MSSDGEQPKGLHQQKLILFLFARFDCDKLVLKQASFDTMRYKSRDSALGIGRKVVNHSSWSNYVDHGRCSLIGRVNDHKRADECNVQGECKDVPGRSLRTAKSIAPNIRSYPAMDQHSNRPDLKKM
jgi:hypothetical protein